MDEEEHEAYNNLRDVIKELNANGHNLQKILDDCYTLSNHYMKHTPVEEYKRAYELDYITRNIFIAYENKELK